jgi:hypothetical protein
MGHRGGPALPAASPAGNAFGLISLFEAVPICRMQIQWPGRGRSRLRLWFLNFSPVNLANKEYKMKTWMKIALVTLLFGIPTVPLGRILWPDAVTVTGLEPVGTQIAMLISVSVIESLAFGFGIAFLLLGFSLIKRLAGGSRGWTWAVYLSMAWTLVSWWPHSNMHRVAGNVDQLITIEYTFHVTLVICAVIISSFFLRLLNQNQANYREVPEQGKVPLTLP